MSDIELTAVIERYLNGEMTADERIRFEMLRRENAGVDNSVKEHQEFASRLKQYGERLQFESLLNDIHNEIDVQALKDEFIHHPSLIVRLWRNHHSKISVAASITIFAVLGTLFLTGYLKTQNQEAAVEKLSLKVSQVQKTSKDLQNRLGHLTAKVNPGTVIAPPNYNGTGTGFAISSNGYLVTDFHVINRADSVYIQNADGNAYHVRVVSTDPANDIAILKITDPSFKSFGTLPYAFKKSKSDLGEDVYTLGYSKDDAPVYNTGYISSGTGFKGDTVNYQVSSLQVNHGNSGGPLLDTRGNIIGIVSGRVTQADGTAFAIKSKYLFKAIQAISPDSLKSDKIILNSKSKFASAGRTQQINKLQNYVFMVKVYNN